MDNIFTSIKAFPSFYSTELSFSDSEYIVASLFRNRVWMLFAAEVELQHANGSEYAPDLDELASTCDCVCMDLSLSCP
jgi:hypothetical protein